MKKISVLLAIIMLFAFTLTACQTNNITEADIPSLHYTLMVYSRMPTRAVLSTNEWTAQNQSRVADHISPLEIEFTDYLGLIAGNEIPVTANIGYDDSSLSLPEILDIEVFLINSDNSETKIPAQFTTQDRSQFVFAASKDSGEYIYVAAVKFSQGTVRYAMKIMVEDVRDSLLLSDKNISELPGVTLAIKENTLTNTGLTATVDNDSENEFTFGEYYCVEKEIGGEWYQIPYISQENDVAWNSIGYPVSANADREFEPTDWEWLYGTLDAGKYRFIKDATIGSGGNITKYYFSVEFTLPE